MKKSLLFSLLCILLVSTSCVSQKSSDSFLVKPNNIRFEMSMQDLDCLGTMTVEVEYKKYGLITKIYTVNGEPYNPRYYNATTLSYRTPIDVQSQMSKALYKVHEQYPDADYVLPTYHNKEVQIMNGGKIIKETLTVKVYKIK